jgi:hypothetical protein
MMALSNEDKMLDQTRLGFGKHRGKTPREVAQVDPDYVVWMYHEVRPTPCSRDLYLTCSEAPEYDPDDPTELDAWARDIASDW